jgi:hypothetical protein
MSFSSPVRDQGWRNSARVGLHRMTSFDHTRAQIPEEELQQTPSNSGYAASQATSSEHASSEYLPSSQEHAIHGTGSGGRGGYSSKIAALSDLINPTIRAILSHRVTSASRADTPVIWFLEELCRLYSSVSSMGISRRDM